MVQGSSVQTQQRGGTAQTDKVVPINSGANPYRVIRDWARLDLEARPWGDLTSVSSVSSVVTGCGSIPHPTPTIGRLHG